MTTTSTRTRTTRVAVVGGGRNCEHDVSLASAAAVADGLEPGHDVVRLTIGRDGEWRDEELRPLGLAGAVRVLQSCDVVFPVLHGTLGEDGTLAALCELAGVPYVGSGTAAGAVAMDKWTTKLVAEAVGVRTARGTLVGPGEQVPWTGPVVVKPATAGSSLGVSLVRDPGEFDAALRTARELDDRVLVEEFVVGREFCVAVLGRPDGTRTTAPVEEVVHDGIFDHEAKYSGHPDVRLPAEISDVEHAALVDAAVRVYDALGCRGLARADFFLTADGVVLNEVNSTPGMTEHSAAPLMFSAGGLGFEDLLALLVTDALPS
ncbi:D-alanine--D-alanine ligase [Kineococcus rhizosphaerae]|uniref:D-alanine--D-alanine ligase n=1 Tax=Kineococcus rhizosphaerae TaxID=559628 RepID=A0A2T0R2Y7_9ACTN|nr:D-alanine--D-alanine ligase [Kineococcus rhizosphaerae]